MTKITDPQKGIVRIAEAKKPGIQLELAKIPQAENLAPITLKLAKQSQYTEVSKQFQKLGIHLSPENRNAIADIAKINGNATLEGEELGALERQLEKILLGRGESFWEDFIQKNPSAFDNPDFLLRIFNLGNPGLWVKVSQKLSSDADFVLKFIKTTGLYRILADCDSSLRDSEDFILAAIKVDVRVYFPLKPEITKKGPDFILKLIAVNPEVYYYASLNFPDDSDFHVKAYQSNFAVYEDLSPELKKRFRKDFYGKFKEFDIDFPNRFSSGDIPKVLENRRRVHENDGRDLSVSILTKSDHNGAFEMHRELLHSLLNSEKYAEMYYESWNKKQAKESIREASQDGQRKVKVLHLAGHGSYDQLSLGGPDPRLSKRKDKKRDLYIGIEDGSFFQEIAPYLAEDVVIILDSCSNGEGEHANVNLANVISRYFPRATVYSANIPFGNGSHISEFGEDGAIRDVKMEHRAKSVTYALKPWLREAERLLRNWNPKKMTRADLVHQLIAHYPNVPLHEEEKLQFHSLIQRFRKRFTLSTLGRLSQKLQHHPLAKFYRDYDPRQIPSEAKTSPHLENLAAGWNRKNLAIPGLRETIPVLVAEEDEALWPLYQTILEEDFELAKAMLPPEILASAFLENGKPVAIVFGPHQNGVGEKPKPMICEDDKESCPVSGPTLVLQAWNWDGRLEDLHHQFFSQIGASLERRWTQQGLSKIENKRLSIWLDGVSPYFQANRSDQTVRRLFALAALTLRGQIFGEIKTLDTEQSLARDFVADLQTGGEIQWRHARLRKIFRDHGQAMGGDYLNGVTVTLLGASYLSMKKSVDTSSLDLGLRVAYQRNLGPRLGVNGGLLFTNSLASRATSGLNVGLVAGVSRRLGDSFYGYSLDLDASLGLRAYYHPTTASILPWFEIGSGLTLIHFLKLRFQAHWDPRGFSPGLMVALEPLSLVRAFKSLK